MLEEYAELKQGLKNMERLYLEAVEEFKEDNDFEDIEAQALEELLAEGKKTYVSKYGNVTVRETKSYEWPQEWEEYESDYKDAKKNMQKRLIEEGRFSVNPTLMLAGKPKELLKPNHKKGRIH